jgi:hypothetical protein
VEFEDGLSIPVMRNRTTLHKNLQLEIESFGKSQAARPLYFKLQAAVRFRVSKRGYEIMPNLYDEEDRVRMKTFINNLRQKFYECTKKGGGE